MKRPSAFCAALPSPGTSSWCSAASHTGTPIVSAWLRHAAERGLPEPALRRVRHARERPRVLRVGEEGQVRDGVPDLRPLVELRAADDLVADLRPHEHVLEHPRLRVGPVEDGDLLPADALVDHPLDLSGDVASLGVLVGSSRTLIGSPSPISVHSALAIRPRLLATTALAAERIVCVER